MHAHLASRCFLAVLAAVSCLSVRAVAQEGRRERPAAYLSVEEAGSDYAIQGEYSGEFETREGEKRAIGVQVIALGDGRFRTVGYPGGLPGDGWDGDERYERDASQVGDEVVVRRDGQVFARIAGGRIAFGRDAENPWAVFERVERRSPTLGREPPEGAVVLFDGSSADAFPGGQNDRGRPSRSGRHERREVSRL